MGRTYSLNGFLNAALRRSSKTILVEGPSDKQVMHRIELERFPSKAGETAIDHAGLLDDPSLTGMGNKSKVLAVQAGADALAVTVPKIASVLATLVDREWDGLTLVANNPEPSWTPPVQRVNRFVTTGHSIENYHFDVDCAIEFLKFAFPEHVSATLISELQRMFGAIVTFAAVLSLKIRDDSCIGRCYGLINPSHIEIRGDRVYLDASFQAACASRNIASSASIVVETNLGIDTAWLALADKDFARWLPHGHIGEEIIWSAIAKVALLAGIRSQISNEIAHGHKNERQRFRAQWLSTIPPERRPPLDDAIDWLHS